MWSCLLAVRLVVVIGVVGVGCPWHSGRCGPKQASTCYFRAQYHDERTLMRVMLATSCVDARHAGNFMC